MRFEGDYLIPAAPEQVWQGLNDPEVLARAIPGCNAMERTGDSEFTATVTVRVGPVSANFKGKVELDNLDPPHGYTLRGRGQGGPAGFARGEARIALAPEGEGTRLHYAADVEIGGKLASVGGRLVQGVAKKTADDFFAEFSAVLTGAKSTVEPSDREAPGSAAAMPVIPARHIPLVDRLAWFLVGLAAGVGLTILAG